MHWIDSSEKDTLACTLEKRLWDSADQFRANSSPILGITFLRIAKVIEPAVQRGRHVRPFHGRGKRNRGCRMSHTNFAWI
jgi:hypothetical protein